MGLGMSLHKSSQNTGHSQKRNTSIRYGFLLRRWGKAGKGPQAAAQAGAASKQHRASNNAIPFGDCMLFRAELLHFRSALRQPFLPLL